MKIFSSISESFLVNQEKNMENPTPSNNKAGEELLREQYGLQGTSLKMKIISLISASSLNKKYIKAPNNNSEKKLLASNMAISA